MKKFVKHFKKNWYRYGLESLVVIIGILVAFSLNNWKEERKISKKEMNLLSELKLNLETNINNLENDIKS